MCIFWGGACSVILQLLQTYGLVKSIVLDSRVLDVLVLRNGCGMLWVKKLYPKNTIA